MKIGQPNSRSRLNIPRNANVLDVGSGHNPHPRANVVTDKFIDNNYHRSDNIKVLNRQKFVQADGQNLPFRNKEFDYVICCHVVEHVDNPAKFLDELGRVGKYGYLEAPSLIGEFLIPKESHKWILLDIDKKVVVVDKARVGLSNSHDFGYLFLDFLPRNSFAYKVFQRTQPQVFNVAYEWKDSIDYIVEPEDKDLKKFFTQMWDKNMYEKVIPKRSLPQEGMAALRASVDVFKSVFKSRILSR